MSSCQTTNWLEDVQGPTEREGGIESIYRKPHAWKNPVSQAGDQTEAQLAPHTV